MPALTEAQLAGLFEKVPDLVLIARAAPDGELAPLAANRAYLAFAGLDPGPLGDRRFADVRAAGEPELFEAKLRESLELRAQVHYEEPARLPGGEALLAVTLTPILGEPGEVSYVVSSSRLDVAPPARLESAMGARERLGSILEITHEAYVGMDSYGLITDWNPAAEALFGWHRDEVVGSVLSQALIPERFRDAHERGLQRYLATGEGPVLNTRVELYGMHRDGTEIPVELTISALHTEQGVSFHAFMHDIAARKRADTYLVAQHAVSQVLAGGAPLAEVTPRALATLGEVLEWDVGAIWEPAPGGRVLVCREIWKNTGVEAPEFERMTLELECTPGVGIPGHVWQTGRAIWATNVPGEPNFPRGGAARASGLQGAIGLPVMNEGELLAVIEFFSSRLREADDELLDMLQTIGDQLGHYIRRMQAEAELAAAKAELELRNADLERSNADLEHFAYVASHDLSEPLRMVAGFVQLLQRRYEGKLDPEADEFIAFALSGVDRMQVMINDLLAYSRAGRGELKHAPVDTAELVQEACLLLKAPIDEAGARVETGELPVVEADGGQLSQVLQNLISNGVKFSGHEAPVVTVGAERTSGGWLFSVADNGIGIPPEERENVFKMFQRLHGREQFPGSGIGLAICERIVARHGGEIWVEENPGGGSRFRFTLPD